MGECVCNPLTIDTERTNAPKIVLDHCVCVWISFKETLIVQTRTNMLFWKGKQKYY